MSTIAWFVFFSKMFKEDCCSSTSRTLLQCWFPHNVGDVQSYLYYLRFPLLSHVTRSVTSGKYFSYHLTQMILNTCELLQSSGGAMIQSHNKFPPPFPAITRNLKDPLFIFSYQKTANSFSRIFFEELFSKICMKLYLFLKKYIKR